MRADLAQFFQLNIDDVWAGRVPVRHVLGLINHLTLMSNSRIYALEQGDIEWMGWDTNTSVLASLHNHVVRLIGGLSNAEDKDVEPLMIRPPGGGGEDQPVAEETFPTIAEFSARMFTEFMYGEG